MKIKSISSDYIQQNNTIRCIFSESVLIDRLRLNQQSLPFVFLKSVVKSNILNEAESSFIEKLLQSGIAKLQAAITPDSSGDLELLLAIMAPQGGGTQAVKTLIDKAKTEPIFDNEVWWSELFETFNIEDDIVQQDIIDRVETERPAEAAEEEEEYVNPTDVLDRMEQIGKERQSNAKKRAQLEKRLKELEKQMQMDPQMQEEGIAIISDVLLEFKSVAENSQKIMAVMKSELSALTEEKLPDVNYNSVRRIIKEGLFDTIRANLANPSYAQDKFDKNKQSSDNVRIAKLAIHIAQEHIREKFNATLQDNGLLPKDIIKTYYSWKKLNSKRNKNAKQQAQHKLLTDRLREAMALFGPLKNPPAPEPDEPTRTQRKQREKPKDIPKTPRMDQKKTEKQASPEEIEIGNAVIKTMIRKAMEARQKGMDPDYVIRSYLEGVSRRISPRLAKWLWEKWEASKR